MKVLIRLSIRQPLYIEGGFKMVEKHPKGTEMWLFSIKRPVRQYMFFYTLKCIYKIIELRNK